VKFLPNIKSAIKRVKVTEVKNQRNRAIKASVKSATKNLVKAIETQNTAETENLFKGAVSAVDKAVSKGVLHRNTANRRKAKLARMAQASK
jgi:small subunit ribosomal protein S20